MNFSQIKFVQTTKKIRFELKREDIIELLLKSGEKLPLDAEVTIMIPSGGDWSNTRLEIDDESPIEVTWTEIGNEQTVV